MHPHLDNYGHHPYDNDQYNQDNDNNNDQYNDKDNHDDDLAPAGSLLFWLQILPAVFCQINIVANLCQITIFFCQVTINIFIPQF